MATRSDVPMNPLLWPRAMMEHVRLLRDVAGGMRQSRRQVELVRSALGDLAVMLRVAGAARTLEDWEFQVFSQAGDDGIIQWLVREVPVSKKTFVEFGVEDYTEANTRFLLTRNYWSGLVMDGSAGNAAAIRSDMISVGRRLRSAQAFITAENINDALRTNGMSGPIGLLSIDIDGNDYWVWKAIEEVEASIVVIEYNARFGPERAVVVPYRPDFQRAEAHHSMIYYGASLAALCGLGREKGFDLVGCNSYGNNAFFVRSDLRPASVAKRACHEAYRPAQFQEARRPDGAFAFLSREEERDILEKLPLVEVAGP